MKNYTFLLIVLGLFPISGFSLLGNNVWSSIFSEYHQLNKNLGAYQDRDSDFFTAYWKNNRERFRKIIDQRDPGNFLADPYLAGAMVRGGYGSCQEFEETYLMNCLTEKAHQIIHSIKDVDQRWLKHESREFSCSTNTLGHMFYLGRIIDLLSDLPAVMIEFGSGYGNFARVFRQAYPNSTEILIDFPEMLALAYYFLRLTLPNTKILLHKNAGQAVEPNAINLIPVFFIDQLQQNCDVFVSTFALSETTSFLQNLVVSNKFFDARLVYLTGQIDGWRGIGHTWMTDHTILMKGIRGLYPTSFCSLFHIFSKNMASYEMIGIKA